MSHTQDSLTNGMDSYTTALHEANKTNPPTGTSGLRDGGEREDYGTGAMREPTTGKGRYDLISPQAMHRIAVHTENGAQKYAERNWEHGIPVSRCVDSAFRHLYQYLAGDKIEDHLAAACWNLMAIMQFEEKNPEVCDLPRYKGGRF